MSVSVLPSIREEILGRFDLLRTAGKVCGLVEVSNLFPTAAAQSSGSRNVECVELLFFCQVALRDEAISVTGDALHPLADLGNVLHHDGVGDRGDAPGTYFLVTEGLMDGHRRVKSFVMDVVRAQLEDPGMNHISLCLRHLFLKSNVMSSIPYQAAEVLTA